MQDGERIQKRSRYIWIKGILGILIGIGLCGVIAWAQKSGDAGEKGISLADLGVTEAQQTELETLWKMKRQKQIQAVEDLKTLNRLAKDSLAEEAEIQKTLAQIRMKRKETQQQIEEIEERLLETLPVRAELHLTLLGVLDNGIPPRVAKSQARKKTDETPQQRK